MRTTSVYEFDCLCGRRITSESPDVTCPACGATIYLDWGHLSIPVFVDQRTYLEWEGGKVVNVYTAKDCTCESDPLGRCVIPGHHEKPD